MSGRHRRPSPVPARLCRGGGAGLLAAASLGLTAAPALASVPPASGPASHPAIRPASHPASHPATTRPPVAGPAGLLAGPRALSSHSSAAVAWPGRYFQLGRTRVPDPAVRQWQARMVQLGYRLPVTGVYGAQSAAVTTRFERAEGLSVDQPGIVGPQVWSAAFAPVSPTSGAPTSSAPTSGAPTSGTLVPTSQGTPVWAPPPPASVAGLASGGWVPAANAVAPAAPGQPLTTALEPTYTPAVWMWQQLLVHQGYPVTLDGFYGPQTASATAAFARALGLPAGGTVDPALWQAGFARQDTGPGADSAAGALGALAVSLAAREAGAPYQWGGGGPDSFDCSGLVSFVFAQAGWALPHNAQAQYDVVSHIPVADMVPGDLVFFPDSTGAIYHVGIYAGDGHFWDAPHSGTTVSLQPVWTADILAGRVG